MNNIDESNVQGTVKYDPTTKTLTLNNATITTYGSCHGMTGYIDGLTINLIGANNLIIGNTINDPEGYGIVNQGRTTITGSGSLTISNTTRTAIIVRSADLRIVNTSIFIDAVDNGIQCSDGIVSIKNSMVSLSVSGSKKTINTNNLGLNSCAITQPVGGSFDATQKTIVDADGDVAKQVLIEPSLYNLKVAGTQVTSANRSHVTSLNIHGNVSYEPTTKTLTLDNTSLTSNNGDGVYNKIDGLTINLMGTNSINAYDDGIEMQRNTTITGSGSLTMNSRFGFYCSDADLNIEHTTITATTENDGILGNSKGENVIINRSTITFNSTESTTIIDQIGSLVLNCCTIAQPVGGSVSMSGGIVDANGNNVSQVRIEPNLPALPPLGNVAFCAGSSMELPAVTNGVWSFGGNIVTTVDTICDLTLKITGATTPSILVSEVGTYSVTVTNSNGCANTATIEVTELPSTAIGDAAAAQFVIYPNPNNGEFKISLNGIATAARYQIFDAVGALVHEAEITGSEAAVSFDAVPGFYATKVVSGSNVFVRTIVVQ